MDINLSLSAAPSIATNYLVVVLYDETAPLVVYDYQSFSAPHVAPRNITFTNVDPVVYRVVTYENATATPGGTIRHEFIYDPSFNNAEIRLDLFLTVGVTAGMVAGATSYEDATLEGWEYSIELRQAYGTLTPVADWDYLAGPPPYGWELMPAFGGGGYTFQDNEVWILHFYPKITTITPLPVSSNLFSALIVLTTDTTLDNTNMGKVHLLQSAGTTLNITLPSLLAVTDLKLLTFISDGGTHINASILCDGTDTVQFLNGLQDSIILGQSERICIFKGNSTWNVFQADGNFSDVGSIVYQYLIDQLNTTFADGTLRNRLDYPRLWAYVQTLDVAEVVNDIDWNNVVLNNKAKYSTGDGSTTFRVPLLYTHGFLRGVDGTVRKPGNYQADSIGPITGTMSVTKGYSYTGAPNNTVFGNGDPNHQAVIGGIPFTITSGTETKPKNTGIYLLINT